MTNGAHETTSTIWRGHLRGVPNTNNADLSISFVASASQSPVITSTSLDFEAFVDPHRIPLCLAAGPSLQLGPDDGATRGLLVDLIVHERHHAHADLHQAQDADRQTTWFANGDVQSRVGILARVRRLHLPSNRCDYEYPIVTELLFYASCSDHPESRLLAPTRSSNMFQLWALPLSSERLPHLATLGPRETVVHQRTAEQASTHPAGKTKLSDLFDNASEQRKKARRRGDASNGSFSVTGLLHAQVQPPASDHATKPIAEAQRLGTAIVKAPKRPAVTQIVSATPDSFQDQSIEARNKQAISRTVMACMRVYGMQQRRARVKAGPAKVGESQTSIDDPDMGGDDERDLEYKAVYHQTYKGTLFAFRWGINTEILTEEAVHEVADRLLSMFCIQIQSP